MFEFAEEALNEIAFAIEVAIYRALNEPASISWNVGPGAGTLNDAEHPVAVIGPVADDVGVGRQRCKQGLHGSLIMGLACGQQQPEGKSVVPDDRVDLGAQSSTRTANGVIFAPFFPPAACWWARTIEESIS